MSVIKKMEVKNEDCIITTEIGMQYSAKRMLGSKSYEIFTTNTNERLGVFRNLGDVIDSINTFEKVIHDYNVHCDKYLKEVE